MDTNQDTTTDKAVQDERERCIRCVESHIEMAGEDKFVRSLLIRIVNLIRSGEEEPRPFRPFSE